MRKLLLFLIWAMSAFMLSGCATKTSNFHIDFHIDTRHAYTAPPAPSADAPTAYVADIVDGRVFVDKTSHPGDPTPAMTSAEERARSIGRKRNGFGKALGDYKLKDGQTVQSIVRSVLEDALTESGFNVLHDAGAVTKDTFSLKGVIFKYWTWTDMGFWQLQLVTDIATNMKTENGDTFTIEATERLGCQFGTEKNALQSMNNSIGKFRSAAAAKFKEMRAKMPIRNADK